MNLKNMIFMALAMSIALNGQTSQPENLSLIKRSYNQFKRDLAIVTKCYFSKKFTCTERDIKEARQAAVRLGTEAAALGALIGGVTVGSYYLTKGGSAWYQERKAAQARRKARQEYEKQQRLRQSSGGGGGSKPAAISQPQSQPTTAAGAGKTAVTTTATVATTAAMTTNQPMTQEEDQLLKMILSKNKISGSWLAMWSAQEEPKILRSFRAINARYNAAIDTFQETLVQMRQMVDPLDAVRLKQIQQSEAQLSDLISRKQIDIQKLIEDSEKTIKKEYSHKMSPEQEEECEVV